MGAATARLLVERGASVAICDVLDEAGMSLAQALSSQRGDHARFFHLDVTSEQSWSSVVSDVLAWKGRLDGLVNNAGVVNRLGTLQTDLERFNRVMSVNLAGPFLGIKSAAPHLRASGGGAIVNVASNVAFSAHYDVAYTSSKWGVRGLTKTAAMEFSAWNIRINCICPGTVITEINAGGAHLEPVARLTPMDRVGEAVEIARAIAFLLSDESSFMTGEDLVVDGGLASMAGFRRMAQEAGVPLPASGSD